MREINFKKEDTIKVIAELSSYLDSLDNSKEYTLTVKEKKKRRSLDANAYCWVLLSQLASEMRISKEELYQSYVRDIGGNTDILCIQDKAVDKFRYMWERNGVGWFTETLPSKLQGCTNVIVYYGSSTYDTKQMSVLIDRIVQDCNEAGIETMPPKELERLMNEWN